MYVHTHPVVRNSSEGLPVTTQVNFTLHASDTALDLMVISKHGWVSSVSWDMTVHNVLLNMKNHINWSLTHKLSVISMYRHFLNHSAMLLQPIMTRYIGLKWEWGWVLGVIDFTLLWLWGDCVVNSVNWSCVNKYLHSIKKQEIFLVELKYLYSNHSTSCSSN